MTCCRAGRAHARGGWIQQLTYIDQHGAVIRKHTWGHARNVYLVCFCVGHILFLAISCFDPLENLNK